MATYPPARRLAGATSATATTPTTPNAPVSAGTCRTCGVTSVVRPPRTTGSSAPLPKLMTKVTGCMANRQIARDLLVAAPTIDRQVERLGRPCLLFHLEMTRKLKPRPRSGRRLRILRTEYHPSGTVTPCDTATGVFLSFTDRLRRKASPGALRSAGPSGRSQDMAELCRSSRPMRWRSPSATPRQHGRPRPSPRPAPAGRPRRRSWHTTRVGPRLRRRAEGSLAEGRSVAAAR